MGNIPGFQCYSDYVLIKNHFNNDKFNWNANAVYKKIKLNAFEKRNDQTFFIKLEYIHRNRSDCIENLISGFLYSRYLWIGEFFEDIVVEYHQNRLSRIKSLESQFQIDCEKMDFLLYDSQLTLDNVLLTKDKKDPIILSWFLKNEISLETLVILHQFTQWVDTWNPSNPLHKERKLQINKYRLLLNLASYNTAKIENIYQKLAQIRVSAHSA